MNINIGFIGAGDISFLHAQAIARLPQAHLKGIWNITEELAREKCQLFGCKHYQNLQELLYDPEIQAIFVLTNLESHHQYVMQALDAGKHVFVEKPVGVSTDEIREMQQKADQVGKICMPGHNYIYDPSVRRAKNLLDSGKLGKLVSLYVLYNIHHPEEVAARYPGVVRQILTHHSYITLFLAGIPRQISAMKSVIHYKELQVEDIAMVTMKMDNQALVHFCASFAADDHAGDPWTMMIKAIGTKGATRFSYRDWVENTPAQVHSQTYSAYPYSIDQIAQYFIESCIMQGNAPLSTMEDAMVAQKMIEGIEASIEEGKHIFL